MEARLLYRDGLMLVIDKPAGLPVHRGPKGAASKAAGIQGALQDHFDALRFGLPRAPELAHRLDRETAGISVTPRPLVDLTRSMADIRLDHARVDADAIIRLERDQWTALSDHAAIALACDAIGGADSLFGRTVDYLNIREQFGRPIGSFQALKHRMADWKVKIEAVRMLVRHSAAMAVGNDARASEAASGAKAYACDTYAAFAADSVQLHGGIGFTWEHPCHLFLKRAKLSQQLFGNSKLHKERVAELAFC